MSRLPALAAWLLAALLVTATFATVRSQAQDKPIADSTITEHVQSAIDQDRVLAKLHIEVRTHEGMVNLTGFVRSLEDIARAGTLARAVRGVSGVTNRLRVANRPSQA